jgi:hypothetical protein
LRAPPLRSASRIQFGIDGATRLELPGKFLRRSP